MQIKLVISDFDNTLYDWFAMWHSSFSFLLGEIEGISKAYPSRSELLRAIRTIHQSYGTSEYGNLLDELPKIWDEFSEAQKDVLQKTTNSSYLNFKANHTVLYDNVMPTILSLKERGVNFVVYTESQPAYSEDRLVTLELDGIVDALYAPETQGLIRSDVLKGRKRCKITNIRTLPKHDKKPNPAALLDIIKDFGVDKSQVIYIGDSLMKDICMANHASVTSVFAEYGIVNYKEEYNLLREVSHWPDNDVAKEVSISSEDCVPNFTIGNFSEILSYFKF